MFFKQFFSTVLLGVLHGLVLLPVLLSVCGPKPYPSATPAITAAEMPLEPIKPSSSPSQAAQVPSEPSAAAEV